MKVIGLTGGIGSGKSTVAKIFKSQGVPVFDSDKQAKALYKEDKVKQKVLDHFGQKVFENGVVSFKKLAAIIFSDATELKWINDLIHPLVHERFKEWMLKQDAELVIKESAILLQSGAVKNCDTIVVVEASQETRVKRVMQRDGISREQVLQRLVKQSSAEKIRQHADFVVNNDGAHVIPQVIMILNELN